jgi:hypothetical protein
MTISVSNEQLKHQLIIADIQEVDSGVYSCKCGTAKTSCKLNVKGCRHHDSVTSEPMCTTFISLSLVVKEQSANKL